MTRRFVVLGSQRSGTVFIQELISSHPDAHCFGEILLGMDGPTKVGYPKVLAKQRLLRHGWQHVLSGSATRPGHVIEAALQAGNGVDAVGFRIMYNQLNRRAIRALLRTDASIIHVRRSNTLRQFTSLMQMRQRQATLGGGSAHARSPQEKFAPTSVDAAKALAFVAARAAEQRRFSELFGSRTASEIFYERDILLDPSPLDPPRPQLAAGVRSGAAAPEGHAWLDGELARALELPVQPLTGSTTKSGTKLLADSISNFAEVEAAFHGTEHAWMLTT